MKAETSDLVWMQINWLQSTHAHASPLAIEADAYLRRRLTQQGYRFKIPLFGSRRLVRIQSQKEGLVGLLDYDTTGYYTGVISDETARTVRQYSSIAGIKMFQVNTPILHNVLFSKPSSPIYQALQEFFNQHNIEAAQELCEESTRERLGMIFYYPLYDILRRYSERTYSIPNPLEVMSHNIQENQGNH